MDIPATAEPVLTISAVVCVFPTPPKIVLPFFNILINDVLLLGIGVILTYPVLGVGSKGLGSNTCEVRSWLFK